MADSISIRRRVRMPAEERRRQIIDVATAIIAERGYWGLSLQDVADSCGLTVNGVLHHVGSKDGLLVAVLDHRDETDARALASLLGIDLPDDRSIASLTDIAVERGIGIGAMCRAVVERNAAQPEIVRLYSVLEAESMSPEHPAHDYFTERQRIALSGFARLLAPRDADAEAFARHILAVMDGLQLQWLREPGSDLLAIWDAVSPGVAGLEQ